MAELIIFDFDGTLSDSRHSIVLCFQGACRERGFEAPDEQVIAPLIGLPLVEMFPRSLGELGIPEIDALVQSYRDLYVPIDLQHTSLFEGVPELLSGLAGRRMAIATSKSQQGAERSVGRAGLTHHFEMLVGHDSVARPKPNPDMIEFILERTGVAPQDAVMVGDTTFDLEMADNAGVRAVGVSWGMHGAERLARWEVVQDMAGLRGALG